MSFITCSCEDFVEALSSREPVPGGGGASALVGAIGVALGNMVGSLTVGKKKYAAVEADIIALQEKASLLQKAFLALVEEDAKAFEPLAKAYGLPKETDEEKAEKARIMEMALRTASEVPLRLMQKCCEAIELMEEFAQKGSVIAISDAGVGVLFCKSALQGASLNVFINTKAMQDREYAEAFNKKAEEMLAVYTQKADSVFARVQKQLQ